MRLCLNPDEIASQVVPVKGNIHARNNLIFIIINLCKFLEPPSDNLSLIYDAVFYIYVNHSFFMDYYSYQKGDKLQSDHNLHSSGFPKRSLRLESVPNNVV